MLAVRQFCSVVRSCPPPLASRLSVARHLTTATAPPDADADANHTPAYHTQRKALYSLPFYGAPQAVLDKLSPEQVQEALRAYGGLIRARDDQQTLFKRLQALTNAAYRPKQLTIQGVVVSNKMDKSVVIAAKRLCFSSKLQKSYHTTRRFMAHDEQNLCREGDHVVIRSCRLLSKRKSHVVVLNYGDPTRPSLDQRSVQMHTT